MSALFNTSLFLLFYVYIGYGLVVYLLIKFRDAIKGDFKARERSGTVFTDLLPVTLIIAAYNEEAVLNEKLTNCFDLQYPPEKLEIIFVIDGSEDRSEEILKNYQSVVCLNAPLRRGKTAALNRAVEVAKNTILIFSDANTMLNSRALIEIASKYDDPKVGGVAGEKKVMKTGFTNSDEGEGLYWKYESMLKKLDSSLYTVVGAAGELFSIRSQLYEKLDEKIILDDFVLSMRINLKGYTVKYAETAYAMELPSENVQEELKRKIRISAGAFQAMLLLLPLLNVFRFPVVAFQYISHRVLRWTLCPLSLMTLLASNFFLLHTLFYQLFLGAQICFYLAALIGYTLAKANKKPGPFYVPYYFSVMNFALVAGFFRFIQNNQSAIWEKAQRKVN